MKLRPYQEQAIQSIYDYFSAGKKAPLIVTPTGSGKSVILGEFIRSACMSYPETKILVVTHVKELVEQDFAKIKEIWPAAPAGVYSAGLKKKQFKPVTVASIQSCYSKSFFHGFFDLIIIDEAHLIPQKSSGMYRKLLDSSIESNAQTKLIGLTATPYRLDSGLLHEGDGALFDGISYEASVSDLIEQGYLCRLTARHGSDVNLDGVKILAGEFHHAQLAERMSAIDLVESHADTIVSRCKDRNAWLIFSVTVDHAAQISAALKRRGISADYVSGDMPSHERDEKIAGFKSGDLRALVNCSILTTGFDHPATDAVIMLRPTMSPGLYVQMVGRGLRLHPGKSDCLVLDFGGNVRRHGFIDRIEPPRKGRKGTGEAPVKKCPKCSLIVAAMTKTCPECFFQFPLPPKESESTHHVGAILSTEIKPEWLKVDRAIYSKHKSKSGVDTLRVDYYAGLQRISEWVCLEHSGYARTKAEKWWRERSSSQTPSRIDDAIRQSEELLVPQEIEVSFAGKYPEIRRSRFSQSVPHRPDP